MSWAVILPLTGIDLPTLVLIGGEAPRGCHKGFLPPDVDGFLKRKEVYQMEKLARIMFSKGNKWLQNI